MEQHNIHATFFLEGRYIQEYPELYQTILAKNHVVGNHGFAHKNGWLSTKKNYLKDVEQCQQFMPNNTLFRPPYGKISCKQISELKKKYKYSFRYFFKDFFYLRLIYFLLNNQCDLYHYLHIFPSIPEAPTLSLKGRLEIYS